MIVALLALAIAQPTIALPGLASSSPAKAGSLKCKTQTIDRFRTFSQKVWRLVLWKRGKPKRRSSAIRAQRRRLKCARSPGHLRAMQRTWKRDRRRYLAHRADMLAHQDYLSYLEAITPPGLAVLETIAACESGGDPGVVSASGSYRGKFQFDYGTWESVGGTGDPAAASEREQDERAAALYRARGSSPWPVCGV